MGEFGIRSPDNSQTDIFLYSCLLSAWYNSCFDVVRRNSVLVREVKGLICNQLHKCKIPSHRLSHFLLRLRQTRSTLISVYSLLAVISQIVCSQALVYYFMWGFLIFRTWKVKWSWKIGLPSQSTHWCAIIDVLSIPKGTFVCFNDTLFNWRIICCDFCELIDVGLSIHCGLHNKFLWSKKGVNNCF